MRGVCPLSTATSSGVWYFDVVISMFALPCKYTAYQTDPSSVGFSAVYNILSYNGIAIQRIQRENLSYFLTVLSLQSIHCKYGHMQLKITNLTSCLLWYLIGQ